MKKTLAVILAFSLAMILLSGCAPNTPAPTSPAGTSPSGTTKPDEGGEEPSHLKGELTLAAWDYDKSKDLQTTVSEYEESRGGVTVKIADYAAADYVDKVAAQLAGGNDISVIDIMSMTSFAALKNQNRLEGLNSYITDGGIDMTVYGGLEEDLKLDGEYYAMPVRSDFWVLFYNKDLFDAAGAAYPTNDMTWQQYAELAEKVTSGSEENKVYGAYTHTWRAATQGWAVVDGKSTLLDTNYGELKSIYDIFLPMMEKKTMMSFTDAKNENDYRRLFGSQKIAMLPMGTWLISSLFAKNGEDFPFNWGIVNAPHFEGTPAGHTFGTVTPAAMNKDAADKDLAWDFIKWRGSEECAKILAKAGSMPALRNASTLQTYYDNSLFPEDENSKAALVPANTVIEMPPHEKGAEVDAVLQSEHAFIMTGEKTVEQGIAAMEERAAEILG